MLFNQSCIQLRKFDIIPGKETEESGSSKLGCRHFVVLMLFVGMANAYVMRTNMSVAIVAMVEHPVLPSHAELLEGELTECEQIWHANNSHKVKIAFFDN
jgi:ABC-type uncharacterized transport system substrate-binding protein